MTNPYLDLTPDDFHFSISRTIPRGYAWTVAPDSVQGQMWVGIAASVQALHARAGDLSERESDPAQTVELLADWESAYGLPNPCTPSDATIQQRQGAFVARVASQGEQSIAYYVSAASVLDCSIAITEFH